MLVQGSADLPYGPTLLSLVMFGVYLVVAALAAIAALRARHYRQPRRFVAVWAGLAALFVILALWRIGGMEDVLREAMRSWLRGHEMYAQRRTYQWPAAAAAFAIAVFGAGVLLAKFRGAGARRRERATIIALACGWGMIALVAVRVISFSQVDRFLYGPLKLNWIADAGFSAGVALLALYYLKLLSSQR